MRILVTGASGMLGYSLVRLAMQEHEVWGSYNSFPVSIPGSHTFAMDLRSHHELKVRMTAVRPEAVIHTAAWTNVDQCEKEPAEAKRVNSLGTKNLALVATEIKAAFVYISTDYVFDGAKGNYREEDTPSPINVYGSSKLLGEEAVMQACPVAVVIRTSLFGFNVRPKTGLVEHVLESLRGQREIMRFQDQYFSPIYTSDLGRLILELLRRGSTGLLHIGGKDRVSRYEFSLKVANVFSLPQACVKPADFVPSQDSAPRPRDTSLSGKKVEAHLGIDLPTVAEGLARLREDLEIYRRTKGER